MHFIAKRLALACALSAFQFAHAQSSVSLSGTVDAALSFTEGSLTSRKQMISGGNATSKLIFRGIEDLGGGMYANFWLESGFNADDGTFQSVPNNNQRTAASPGGFQGMTFNRRSFVGIGGAWGEVRFGREWSPSYETFTGKYDPFALSIGLGMNYAAGIDRNAIRNSDAIAYISPKLFDSVTINMQHWRGEGTGTRATENDGSGSGIRVSYDKGPLNAAAVFMRTRFYAGDATYRNIAAAYNFGPVRISFNADRNQQAALRQRGWLVGMWIPVGVVEFKASYSTFRANTAGDPEAAKIALGLVYNLSKRSALYSTFARIRNNQAATLALPGATTAAGRSSRGIEFGMRHNF